MLVPGHRRLPQPGPELPAHPSHVVIAILLFSAACDAPRADDVADAGPRAGEDGDACADDDACAPGLVCNASHLCVVPTADPCDGVTCSGHGTCVGSGAPLAPSCACDDGFVATGLDCLVPGPGVVVLEASGMSVDEAAGALTVRVLRTAGALGAVSVSYSTRRLGDGASPFAQDVDFASPGDYDGTYATLAFADGETEKSFSVAILDDATVEGVETFEVYLLEPTGGASLGAAEQIAAVVTIVDDDQPSIPTCEGQTCSNHGSCVVAGMPAAASCTCDDGYHAVGLACIADTAFAGCSGAPAAVATTNFDDGSAPGWDAGSQAGGSIDFSDGFLHAGYPVATGEVYAWFSYDLRALGLTDLFIEFDARMPSQTKHGLKFLKIFGQDDGGYANTTFGLDYTGIDDGGLLAVSYGDGTSRSNDTQNIINLDGTERDLIGRSSAVALVSTPQNAPFSSATWGTDWHHFRARIKFNSGSSADTEVADGAIYLEIDGQVYVDATGLFNRHFSNGPIDRVELTGWSQGDRGPFAIDYDNVVLSTGCFIDP